jgi:hypothetical protein
MSRVEYPWQGALEKSLLPFPRPSQATKVLMFNLSAIHRPVLAYFVAVHGGFGSQYTSPSVSRSAGLLTQASIVPAESGGNDHIENAIAVCFECHAEIHT